jgi:oleate hydratase
MYFVGGGLASLAGAAYLIRDCNVEGETIHILESMPILGMPILGGSNGIGTSEQGFVCRGGRRLNKETYENFWDLFYSIPSLNREGVSVSQEILEFDHDHPKHANARLINKKGEILDIKNVGFHQEDRRAMLKLLLISEEKLDNLKISDWFGSSFFETNFWYLWQTTFAFQEWSSLFEFRRSMHRMRFEISRIGTLEGVTRSPYNQYDSVFLPLKAFLTEHNVDFMVNCTVTDLDFEETDEITVTAIHYKGENGNGMIQLHEGDLCFVTNGCMTDCAALGDYNTPAPFRTEPPVSGSLWAKLAGKKPLLGNPAPFFGKPEETNWESFTVTLNGIKLLKKIETSSRNITGTGDLMIFKDSGWRMSIVVAAQPHSINQPENQTVFWGYGLYTDKPGDYVKKPMRECTGKEILIELLHHLHLEEDLEEILKEVVNVIPCMMPYIDAQYQPRAMTDRPKVVPDGSVNLAMISQFVEIPGDMVFTEEYSIRAARTAVYALMGINRPISPVTHYHREVRTKLKALTTRHCKKNARRKFINKEL